MNDTNNKFHDMDIYCIKSMYESGQATFIVQ